MDERRPGDLELELDMERRGDVGKKETSCLGAMPQALLLIARCTEHAVMLPCMQSLQNKFHYIFA